MISRYLIEQMAAFPFVMVTWLVPKSRQKSVADKVRNGNFCRFVDGLTL